MKVKSNVTMKVKNNRLTLRQGGEQIRVSGAEIWKLLQAKRRLENLTAYPIPRRVK